MLRRLNVLLLAISVTGAFLTLSLAAAQSAAKDIYPAPEAAKGDIKEALAQAARLHKRIRCCSSYRAWGRRWPLRQRRSHTGRRL